MRDVFLIHGPGRAPIEVADFAAAERACATETRELAARGIVAPAVYIVAATRYDPTEDESGEAIAAAIEAAAIAEHGVEAVRGNLSDDEVRRRRGLPPKEEIDAIEFDTELVVEGLRR